MPLSFWDIGDHPEDHGFAGYAPAVTYDAGSNTTAWQLELSNQHVIEPGASVLLDVVFAPAPAPGTSAGDVFFESYDPTGLTQTLVFAQA